MVAMVEPLGVQALDRYLSRSQPGGVVSADFHAAGSGQGSGEFVADDVVAEPGNAGGGDVCLAEYG